MPSERLTILEGEFSTINKPFHIILYSISTGEECYVSECQGECQNVSRSDQWEFCPGLGKTQGCWVC